MNGDVRRIHSLYRSCLREIRSLPIDYLRQFFRLKVGDDVRAVVDQGRPQCTLRSRVMRVKKDLFRLRRANDGHVDAFQHLLETAYGRRGRLKWEILQPLRTESGAEPPPPIIPSVESSRPPVWSAEMKALLTHDISRTTKALNPNWLRMPPNIPPSRFDPGSPEYLALGPFSKRREVNARWRFFTQELQKTYYPLQVTLQQRSTPSGALYHATDDASLAHAGVRSTGLQGAGVFEEIEALACPPAVARLENGSSAGRKGMSRVEVQSHLPPRFLRRRFQELLAKTPVLTCTVSQPSEAKVSDEQQSSRRYRVTLSPFARRRQGLIQSIADETDMAWLTRAREIEDRDRRSKQKGNVR